MTILITRPHKHAIPTAKKILQIGLQPLMIPLLKIKYIDVEIPQAGYDGLVISSQNAVAAISANKSLFRTPIFVVGEQSKALLAQHGFRNIKYVAENIQLLQMKLATFPNHKFLYICGRHITVNLEELIGVERLKQLVVYEAEAIIELTTKQIELINKKVRIVLFYSARTAKIWWRLCKKHELKMEGKTAICISADVAKEIYQLNWRFEPMVAVNPTEAAMFAYVQEITKP